MKRTVIMGVGRHLPDRVVTNQELTQWMETSDEWIEERSGIKERRWVDKETPPSQLAEKAARQAAAAAGIEIKEINAILLATLSAEHDFPGTSVFLQERLGLAGVPAIDIRAQCSGFIYGLSMADAWIRTGQFRHVLVVGCEVHSTGLDISTEGRDVACLFGDAAAAVVLGPGEESDRGILSTHLHADGRYASALWIEAPGSGYFPKRLTREMMEAGKHFPKMKGRLVFTHAVRLMPEVIREALQHNGLQLEQIDLIVPHQANLRINEAMAAVLKFPMEKVYSNIQRYGNTTAASIPLALHDAQEEGRLKRGNLVMLVSFGAGFTWASAVVRW